MRAWLHLLALIPTLMTLALVLSACAHRPPAMVIAEDAATAATATATSGSIPVVAPGPAAEHGRGAFARLAAEIRRLPPGMAPQATPYTLAGGDRVRIFVYGQPSLSRIYPIDGSGFLSIPLIGPLNVEGLTTYDLEIMLAARLGAKYVRDPKVSVEVAAYRPFFILGEVRNPGQYPYVPGMTVHTAVAIAGGYSPRANERKVQITRPINGSNHVTVVPSTFAVWAGDTIYVPERFF